jgi:hypothetical protein
MTDLPIASIILNGGKYCTGIPSQSSKTGERNKKGLNREGRC